jgi:hypothetical protein
MIVLVLLVQTVELPVSWTFEFWMLGADRPFQQTDPLVLTCGVAQVSDPGYVINPRTIYLDNPFDNGATACTVDLEAQIVALPIGDNYTVTAIANGANGSSQRSAFSNAFRTCGNGRTARCPKKS